MLLLVATWQGHMARGRWAPALWDGIALGDEPVLNTRESLALGEEIMVGLVQSFLLLKNKIQNALSSSAKPS